MSDDTVPAPSRAAAWMRGPARRTFIARLAGAVAMLPALTRQLLSPRIASADGVASSAQPAQPNAALLAALGAAVLPAELGPDATRRAVSEFQRWMDGYRPGTEANHGYGTATIRRLPPDARPLWRAQLVALDANARRERGRSFAALARGDAQAMLRTILADERGEALPAPLAARHVALALLAHFYESPTANDLCYDATIGRQQCRPLSTAPHQPVPLTRRAR